MSWSFSADRKFQACQRQWYIHQYVAHHAAADPNRRLAYLLSKLQSVSSWRGSLIDGILSEKVVAGINTGRLPPLNETLSSARQRFDEQVNFARAHRLHEKGMVPSKHPGVFAAWHDVEYEQGVTEEALLECWEEVSTCITNFYEMPEVIHDLKAALRCFVQRPLSFEINGVSIRALPDVILFRRGRPPLIADWKTYRNDNSEHRLQLACYALALTKCKKHIDFPQSINHLSPVEIDLVEIQLFSKKTRPYKLTEDDFTEVETFITESAFQMDKAIGDMPKKHFNINLLPAASSPTTCSYCSFKRICWEG